MDAGLMRRLLLVLLPVAIAGAVVLYAESTEPGWWLRLRYPLEYESIVLGHAENDHLDAALIAAVIYGSFYLRRLLSGSGRKYGLVRPARTEQSKDAGSANTGLKYWRDRGRRDAVRSRPGWPYFRPGPLTKYDGGELALAAYHAGQGNVDEWVHRGGGIEFAETREYVEYVLELRDRYRKAYGL
jgi:hypothetical protein